MEEDLVEPTEATGRRVPDRPVTAYLGLGSSLGDRIEHLETALKRLHREGPDLKITAVSSLYESPHLGLHPGDELRHPPHLNLAAEIETRLSPMQLLALTQQVEEEGGRRHDERWGPRTIDIDLLFYGSLRLESAALTLPHREIAHRAFVVLPLAELNPELRLADGRTLAALAKSDEIRSQRIELYKRHSRLPYAES